MEILRYEKAVRRDGVPLHASMEVDGFCAKYCLVYPLDTLGNIHPIVKCPDAGMCCERIVLLI
jgi:hypothetical protein